MGDTEASVIGDLNFRFALPNGSHHTSAAQNLGVFRMGGPKSSHRIAHVDPSKRNMISHIFFVNEKSSFLLSLR